MRTLATGISSPSKRAIQLKWSAASSGALETTGRLRVPANEGGDVAHRDALVGRAVVPCTGRALLQRQPEEAGRIEPVPGGPTVKSLPDVGRHARLTGDIDEGWHKGVVAVVVD